MSDRLNWLKNKYARHDTFRRNHEELIKIMHSSDATKLADDVLWMISRIELLEGGEK